MDFQRLVFAIGVKPCHFDPVPQYDDSVDKVRECGDVDIKVPLFHLLLHIQVLLPDFLCALRDIEEQLDHTLDMIFYPSFDFYAALVANSEAALNGKHMMRDPLLHFLLARFSFTQGEDEVSHANMSSHIVVSLLRADQLCATNACITNDSQGARMGTGHLVARLLIFAFFAIALRGMQLMPLGLLSVDLLLQSPSERPRKILHVSIVVILNSLS